MSALFNQAARQERERFFYRLDSQWGKGLKQKTHPDRSPDFRVISKPNIISEWGVYSFGDRGLVYEASTKKQARAWLLAVLALYPLARLELRALAQRSKQTAPLSLPRTDEARLHSDSQTLVTAHREPIGKTIDHVALGTFSDAPSAIDPRFAGFAEELEKAPRERTDSAIATSVCAQLELELVGTPRLVFTSNWQWPRISFDYPVPIPTFTAAKQMRLPL